MKVWVAYIVHEQDTDVLVSDGIGWMAVGCTEVEAKARVVKKFYDGYETPEDAEAAREFTKMHCEEQQL